MKKTTHYLDDNKITSPKIAEESKPFFPRLEEVCERYFKGELPIIIKPENK